MKKILAIYRGDSSTKAQEEWSRLSPEEQKRETQRGIEGWGKWMQENGTSVVYPGGPLGKTLAVSKEGIASTKNKDCGFVVIEAATHEEAAKKFLNHPHFSIFPGENVEIMECLPIPGKM